MYTYAIEDPPIDSQHGWPTDESMRQGGVCKALDGGKGEFKTKGDSLPGFHRIGLTPDLAKRLGLSQAAVEDGLEIVAATRAIVKIWPHQYCDPQAEALLLYFRDPTDDVWFVKPCLGQTAREIEQVLLN